MQGEFSRLRELLLEAESKRLEDVESDVQRLDRTVAAIPDTLADELRRPGPDGGNSRLARMLSELTAGSLEVAVRRRPQMVADAIYPVMGPAIRRAIAQAMRQMTEDFDTALRDTLSLRSLKWRLEAWRAGVPYAQVVLRHTTRYQVEHLLLIDPASGLLFGHVSATGLKSLDADAVAGMFTAISHFVRDSVALPDADSRFEGARIGEYQLLASHGSRAWLVAFVRGVAPNGLSTALDALNEELHARNVADFGTYEDTCLHPPHLDELNRGHEQGRIQPRGRRWAFFAALGLLVVLLTTLVWRHWSWTQDAARLHERLAATDGLVVTSAESVGYRRFEVVGLLDAGAQAPQQAFAQEFPDVGIQWQLQPFLSLAPDRVRTRAAHTLGLPLDAIGAPDSEGRVAISGEVTFSQWHRARHAPPIPGVLAIDLNDLHYPERGKIEDLLERVRAVRIGFEQGSPTPSEDMSDRVAMLLATIDELQRTATPHGIAFSIEAHGFTDEQGSFGFNRELRERRAEWLATRLMERLQAPSIVRIDPIEAATLPYRGNERSAFLSIEAIPGDAP